MTRHTLLRARLTRQLRGPAWLTEDGWVVMDVAQATWYEPLSEPRLGIECARLRTPDDVVAFVQRYGLPNTAYGSRANKSDLRGRDGQGIRQLGQEVNEILEGAKRLRASVQTGVDVQHAARGDALALARIRQRFDGADDRARVLRASQWVTSRLTSALSESTPLVYDRAVVGESATPGEFRIGIQPLTLYDVCVFLLAYALAGKEPLDICQECTQPFIVEHQLQKFCTLQCGGRARARKFKEKHSQHSKTKGSRHGTAKTRTTRTR